MKQIVIRELNKKELLEIKDELIDMVHDDLVRAEYFIGMSPITFMLIITFKEVTKASIIMTDDYTTVEIVAGGYMFLHDLKSAEGVSIR